MEKKEVTINNPTAIAGLTIIPVVHVSLHYWLHNGGGSFFGIKEPVAVIVVSPTAKRAFRLTGEEVSIEQLTEEISELKEEILQRL